MDANYTKILEAEEALKFQVGDYIRPKGDWGKKRLYRITSIEILKIMIQIGPDEERDVKPALLYALFVDLVRSPDGSKIYNWINPKQVELVDIYKDVADILYK